MLVRWREFGALCVLCESQADGFYDVTSQCGVWGGEVCGPCAEAISEAVKASDEAECPTLKVPKGCVCRYGHPIVVGQTGGLRTVCDACGRDWPEMEGSDADL